MTISLTDRILRTTLCACIAVAASSPLLAGETSKNPVATEEETFNNWVEVGTGGMILKGNKGEGRQQTGVNNGMFGGINDMHLEQSLGNKWFAKLDGHAIFGNNDYNLLLDISKPDVGYLRVGYKQFRTYYNEMGGFFPNTALPGDGVIIPPYNQAQYVDRGDVWAELGLRAPNLPEITFRYEHDWRDGTKDSTIWGDTALTGANLLTANTRKIVPAFRDLNEKRDTFVLDVKQTFGNTDLGVGARADLIKNDDTLNTIYRPGEYNPNSKYSDVKLDRYLTQDDSYKSDTFSTHFTSETRFGEKLWLTSGYEFSTLNSNIGGSRIFGENFNPSYAPIFGLSLYRNPNFPNLPIAATSGASSTVGNVPSTRAAVGYLDLVGGSEMNRHEFNVNLMWIPIPDFSVLAGFRLDHQDVDSVSAYTETNTNAANAYYYSKGSPVPVPYLQPTLLPYLANSSYGIQNLAESLELRYTGVTNWVFYTRCDLDEDSENVEQFQKSALVTQEVLLDKNGNPVLVKNKTQATVQTIGGLDPGTTKLDTFWNSNRLAQKYTAGINWYPLQRLSFSTQYYHKDDNIDFSAPLGDAYFNSQNFNTDDVNFRMTVRPFCNLSLVSRYDYQRVTSYLGAEELQPQQCATQVNNMFSESVTWNPLDRLYLQGNFSYVMSETNTPAAIGYADPTNPATYVNGGPAVGPANLSFKNNYWTASLGAGFALDEKTELHADYTYFRANDYGNNDLFGNSVVISQPYGTGLEEQTVDASIQRQLCRNARLTLKYTFFSSRDETSYGYGNFTGHLISTSVMVRF